MNKTTSKSILVSIIIILVVTCICLGMILAGGVGVALFWPFEVNQQDFSPTPVSNTLAPTQPVGEVATQENELPSDLKNMISEIESQVMQVRGLELRSPIDHTLISAEELETIVREDFFAEYREEDARKDVIVLSLLGLLPPEYDLRGFYNELYTEQISGFYDDQTEEIFVLQSEGFDGNEKLVYAHEFTHVLQDQTFDYDEGLQMTIDACEVDSERCAAIQALIEGDASLTEVLWFQSFGTRDDYQDLLDTYENFSSPILENAPPFIQADLYFPYERGLNFVQGLYDIGGYPAVDEVYLNPPVSTEQILHPERYPSDVPQPVTLPDIAQDLGEDWMLFDQNIMGEWYIYLILNQGYEEGHRLSEEVAAQAAEGWGGDAYAFYFDEESQQTVFVLDAVWDSLVDAGQFVDAFEDYADLRWSLADAQIMGYPTWMGSDQVVVFAEDGSRTLWLIGPTIEILENALGALQ